MQPIPTRAKIARAWLEHAHSFDRCVTKHSLLSIYVRFLIYATYSTLVLKTACKDIVRCHVFFKPIATEDFTIQSIFSLKLITCQESYEVFTTTQSGSYPCSSAGTIATKLLSNSFLYGDFLTQVEFSGV